MGDNAGLHLFASLERLRPADPGVNSERVAVQARGHDNATR